MTSRHGKIARLPRELRDQLNARLHDGEPQQDLVLWLNAEPAASAVLADQFDGRPITEQNLSEWKKGGFPDWLREQEARVFFRSLRDEAAGLSEDAGGVTIAATLAGPVAVALGRFIQHAAASPDDPAQRTAFLTLARELTLLRRVDLAEDAQRIQRERWQIEQEKHLAEADEKRRNEEINAIRLGARRAEAETRKVLRDFMTYGPAASPPPAPPVPVEQPPAVTSTASPSSDSAAKSLATAVPVAPNPGESRSIQPPASSPSPSPACAASASATSSASPPAPSSAPSTNPPASTVTASSPAPASKSPASSPPVQPGRGQSYPVQPSSFSPLPRPPLSQPGVAPPTSAALSV
jgi:hypothetical protein